MNTRKYEGQLIFVLAIEDINGTYQTNLVEWNSLVMHNNQLPKNLNCVIEGK